MREWQKGSQVRAWDSRGESRVAGSQCSLRDWAHINDEFNLYANKLAALATQTQTYTHTHTHMACLEEMQAHIL